MRVTVITPPAPVVTWAEVDKHLKLDGDDSQQAEVEGFIAAATAHIDGPAGWLGRALGPQTLEGYLPSFGCVGIGLICPPAIEVLEVEYIDAAGATVMADDASYVLRGGLLRPAWPNSWPSAAWRGADGETVRIRWRAGYAELPAPVRAAILLMTEDLYRHRGTVSTGGIGSGGISAIPMSTTVERLLAPFRVFA